MVGIGGAGLVGARDKMGLPETSTWPVNAERVVVKTAGSVVKSTVNGFTAIQARRLKWSMI